MVKETIYFTADDEQGLARKSELKQFSVGTINYLYAQFDLPAAWREFESLRAVWFTDYTQESSIIDESGLTAIPQEVLTKPGTLRVNLCGVNYNNGKLWQRVTTYPVEVLKLRCTNV